MKPALTLAGGLAAICASALVLADPSLQTAMARNAASGAAIDAPEGDPAAGEALFQDRCAMCHLAEGGGQGPSLVGVFGRKAGSAPGFAYSAALRDSGLTWTAPQLDRFLADPGGAVPGTAMPIKIIDARRRADLISYLRRTR